MKKIIFILLLVLSFSLLACKKVEDNKPAQEPKTSADDKTIPVESEPTKVETEIPDPVATKTEEKTQTVINEGTKEVRIGSLYVNYVLNNGSRDIKEKVEVPETYEFLTIEYTGHRLLGWYLDEELTEKLFNSDLTLPLDENDIVINAYAKWKASTFNVTFMNGNQIINMQTVPYGEEATAPTPPVNKYEKFIGWSCDFSKVTSNLTVNALYEKELKNILVVLGNWMNNDGTMSATLIKRLGLALEAMDKFDPLYIVVTGGMANKTAGIAEATAMYNYLVMKGVPKEMLIVENQSMSTEQNAIYTFKLLENIDFDNLIIVSTMEHFYTYRAIQYFNDAALSNAKIKSKGIRIMGYTQPA